MLNSWYFLTQGHLRTEPDFEIQFGGAVRSAADFLTLNPAGTTTRGDFVGEIVPDNGDDTISVPHQWGKSIVPAGGGDRQLLQD